jgi:arsenate reductase
LDSSGQTSKSIDLFFGRAVLDHIIIVCATVERDCPTLEPFALHVERWPLPDPSEFVGTHEEQLNAFRATRDELRKRLAEWLRRKEQA